MNGSPNALISFQNPYYTCLKITLLFGEKKIVIVATFLLP